MNTNQEKLIPVMAAVIFDGNRLLISRRAQDQKLAGFWEFPGGKLEHGETPEQCLVREICEELSITIEVLEQVNTHQHRYDFGTVQLAAYRARFVSGDIKLSVHDQYVWVTPEQLDQYQIAPADLPTVALLKR